MFFVREYMEKINYVWSESEEHCAKLMSYLAYRMENLTLLTDINVPKYGS